MEKAPPKLKNDLLLRVARRQPVERPPVWLMRQAGRFLKEYRMVRAEAGSFRKMIAKPAYAAEVTLQPVDIIGVDAAIIFSDILVVPEAMGLPYRMVKGEGPVFDRTIRSPQDLKRLHPVGAESNLDDTYKAIKLVLEKLENRVPLIGFAGAPWTIFCYMVEGGGSKTFSQARAMCYQAPELATDLLNKITEGTIQYLKGQIAAGVHLVQVFDSWAGLLGPDSFRKWSLPSLKRISEAIEDVPVTVFAKGAGFALADLAQLDCQVIGLDWHTDPATAGRLVGEKALQGNLDPAQLYAQPEEVEKATLEMLEKFPAGRHIANLGHGIYPDLPRESVLAMVETVRNHRY